MRALQIVDKTIVAIFLAALAVLLLPSIALSEETQVRNYNRPTDSTNSSVKTVGKVKRQAKKKHTESQGIGLGILDEKMGVYM